MQALSQDACVARSPGSVLTANSFILSGLLREQNSEKRRGQRTDINVRGRSASLGGYWHPRRGMCDWLRPVSEIGPAAFDHKVTTSGRCTQFETEGRRDLFALTALHGANVARWLDVNYGRDSNRVRAGSANSPRVRSAPRHKCWGAAARPCWARSYVWTFCRLSVRTPTHECA